MGVAPTEPGMPESASTPTQPRSTATATNASQPSPAATLTTAPPQVGSSPSWSARTPMVATSTTVPGKPASATTRLLPPPRTSSGSTASSARRTASTSSASVVARTHDRAGPPRRRVVWSASRSPIRQPSRSIAASGTHDRHGVAQDALPGARHAEGDGALIAPGALDLDLGAAFGDDDGLGELGAELGDPARAAELLVDVARDQGKGEHPVGDHV